MDNDEPAPPKYMRIADELRQSVLDGVRAEGSKLPSNRELASTYGVALATVQRALEQLSVEGVIRTSQRGTFVANTPSVSSSGRDRVARVLTTGSPFTAGEHCLVTKAELKVPPLYVQEIFGIEEGDQVVMREWHVGQGAQRRGLHVAWYPAQFAALVPDLLSFNRSKVRSLLSEVIAATGRRPTHGRDDMHGRDADAREANYLGLRVGSPILAGASRLWDEAGVIEYAEWCLPYRHVIGYTYEL
ncbi:GntR family transcriptional regulator [Streptomyces sp. NPDC094049]|uniref:GntR family transcriptional regulator n=1 Tax=Streptomyces sp. NPDC094049 TaxID=3154987 RepID=UPI003325B152